MCSAADGAIIELVVTDHTNRAGIDLSLKEMYIC